MLPLNQNSALKVGPITYHYIHRTVDNRFSFKSREVGCHVDATEEDLRRYYLSGALTLHEESFDETAISSPLPSYADFVKAAKEHRDIAWQRYEIIQAIYAAGCPKNMRETWPPIIEDAAARVGFTGKRSWQAVRTWMKRYESAGTDIDNGGIAALTPAYGSRGVNSKKRSPQEQAFLWDCIGKYYLDTKASIASAWKLIDKAYLRAKRRQTGTHAWACPSERTLSRLINKISPYEVARRRFGKKHADRAFANLKKGAQARYRLEVVEIDHTILDTWVIDLPSGVVLGRPTLTVAIDRYTRMIVGIYIGFEPPSAYSTLQCMRNMILPKDYMKAEFPEIVGDWPAYGIPTAIITDNDMSFRDESYRSMCAALKITMLKGPAWRPDYRGIIERVNRTFKESSTLDVLPGKTNPKYWKFKDYDPREHATVTLHELRSIIHEWIVTDYMYSPHGGIGDIPLSVWNRDGDSNPIRLPVNVHQLDMLVGILEHRTLSRKGIEFLGLFYNSKELNLLLRQEASDGTSKSEPTRDISFRVNPTNLGEISVVNPDTGELFPVLCQSRKYAEGLTLYQHKALRKKKREEGGDFRDTAELEKMRIQSIDNLDKILARTSTKARRKTTREIGKDFVQQPQTDLSDPAVAEAINNKSRGKPAGTIDVETFGMSDTLTDEFDDKNIPDYETTEHSK